MKATPSRHGWVHMFITHRPTATLQLRNFDSFRTCRTSSFCTVAWQLALRSPSAIAELLALSIRPNGQSEILCTRLKLYRSSVRPDQSKTDVIPAILLRDFIVIKSQVWHYSSRVAVAVAQHFPNTASIRCDFVTFVCIPWFNAVVGPGIGGIDDLPSFFPLFTCPHFPVLPCSEVAP